MSALILPLLLFSIFYFVLIRPQQRKMKEQQALVNRAAAGDRVMLSSGIFGTITEVVDTAAYVELAEGIEILVSRAFIQEILEQFPTEALEEGNDEEGNDEEGNDTDDIDELEDIQDSVDEDADEVDA